MQVSLEFWAGRREGSSNQELLQTRAGFRGREGVGAFRERRRQTRKKDFISFHGERRLSYRKKKERGFSYAAGRIKARHGEGLSLEKKTLGQRRKLVGEVWGVGTSPVFPGPQGGERKTLEGLQRPEPLLEVLMAVGGGLRERGPSGTQQKE